MSDLSDSENDQMSRDADVTGSSSSSLDATGGTTAPAARTPNHLSGIFDIPSLGRPATPTNRAREGAARLDEILQVGPTTLPYRRFIAELNGAGQAQLAPVVDPPDGGDEASERTASPASVSGRDGSESSGSTPPAGEPVQARHRASSRPLHVNGILVFWMADRDIIDRVGDRPVYSVDYFTSAMTMSYLVSLREEFVIPNSVDLVTLTSLNVAPMQLNASAYRILISCFVLWAKNFDEELPFRAFQNLYRIKTTPASSGSYYFQGYQGTFITSCPNTDKQFKHLWFYAGGRWLHGQRPYSDVLSWERVPITFMRGYVWIRGPHVAASCTEKIDLFQKVDPERNQNRLLSHLSLEMYHWTGLSSTSECPDDRPREAQPGEVIIASRIPDPVVHYRAQAVVAAGVATTSDPSEVPRGVPVAPIHGQRSGSSSPGTWGPRVADEDMDLVLRQLFPTRGLRIEGRFNPLFSSGSKLPSEQDRMARLQKLAKIGDGGKGKARSSVSASSSRAGPTAPTTRTPSDPHKARVNRSRDEWPVTVVPSSWSRREDIYSRDPPASVTGAEPINWKSSTQKAIVAKFDDKLTSEVAESSRRSDPIVAIGDCAQKLIEALCLAFSGSATARGYANRMETDVASTKSEARSARNAEKKSTDKVKEIGEKLKDAEKRASEAEGARKEAEDARRKAENDLAAAHSEHSRYLQVALPAALDEARQ
ncbi:hypothetical protein TIFTF001_021615 [Ficus carica]|uniref:Uncharacterized protein n=1 Tax=Ficus carica TaxID=3494 RepID=A0AA88AKQ8_FICCA|nr:hypothetical protein TIFTF001_021615 [Ficus carica]